MKIKFILYSLFVGSTFLFAPTLQASRAKPFASEADANIYLQDHYTRGCQYYNCGEWFLASRELEKVTYFFPCSEEAKQAFFILGVSYYNIGEYDFANAAFSDYLKVSTEPALYEEAVKYKFCIAEHFRNGTKRRLFTNKYCPKLMSANDLAVSIYDEVVVALPNQDIAAQALFSKGCLLASMRDYHGSVEAFQSLIRRFPKNELTPQAYVKIAQTFSMQSRYEFQNPDILGLAQINARRFKEAFPRDERVELAEGYVARIKEMYAKGLSDIGLFYERTKKPDAAIIYYRSAIEQFPDTWIAEFSRERLMTLGYECESVQTPSTSCEAPNNQQIKEPAPCPCQAGT